MTASGTPLRRAWIAILLVVAIAVVFGPAMRFGFVNLDDRAYVTKNPWVRSGLTWDGFLWAWTTFHAANWHPLTWLSLMLDAEIGGVRPAVFHLTSLLLHALNTVLLFLVLEKMTGIAWRSAFVAAAFAVHPLHVESVVWIAERKDVLSTLFWFLTLLAYERHARAPSRSRLMLVATSLALGLTAKPMLVTVPLVLLLLDVWPLERLDRELRSRASVGAAWRGLVTEKIPLLALAALSCAVTFLAQRQGGAVESLEDMPLSARAENALWSYVMYGFRMLWPSPLAALYPHPHETLSAARVGGAALLLAVACFLALRPARRRPYATVGWLWYVVTLLPVIGVVQVGMQARADRYTYVPLVGLFVVVAWGTPDLLAMTSLSERVRKKLLVVAGAVAVVLMMVVASAQARVWRSSRALFEHALEVTQGNYLAHAALGSALAREGDLERAMAHLVEAVRIHPGFVEGHAALATALFRQGRIEEAAMHWNRALALSPSFAQAEAGLAAVLLAEGKTEEAIALCRKALRHRPGEATALTHLGFAHLRQGKVDEAVAHLTEALRNDPEQASAHGYLGRALYQQGKTEEAISHLRESLRLDPSFAEDHFNLANALLKQGSSQEAIAEYRETIRLAKDHVPSRIALGVLLFQQERMDEGLGLLEEAVELAPQSAEARLNLGVALYKSGRTREAVSHFEAVLTLDPANALARRYLELAGAERQ